MSTHLQRFAQTNDQHDEHYRQLRSVPKLNTHRVQDEAYKMSSMTNRTLIDNSSMPNLSPHLNRRNEIETVLESQSRTRVLKKPDFVSNQRAREPHQFNQADHTKIRLNNCETISKRQNKADDYVQQGRSEAQKQSALEEMFVDQQIAYQKQIYRKLEEQKKQMLVMLRKELGTTNVEPQIDDVRDRKSVV